MLASKKFAPLALTLALMLSVLSGCQQRDAPSSLNDARSAIAAKDPAAASIHLKNVLAAEPNNAEARLLLGLLQLEAGDSRAAVVDLRRARELKIPDERVLPALADALVQSGQEKLLIEQFGSARLNDADAQARLKSAIAMAYLALSSAPQARAAVGEALKANSSSPVAKLANAKILFAQKDRDAALRETEALVASAPKFEEGWAYLGFLREQVKPGSEEALQAYRSALGANPKHLPALYGVVALQMFRGDLKAARESYALLNKAWPGNLYTRFVDARLTHLEGKYEQARAQFASLLSVVPENVALLLSASINELKLGSPTQAEAMLARAVSLNPDNQAARYYLAQANVQLGRPERASEALAPLVETESAPAGVLVIAAQAKLLQGDAVGSQRLYDRVAKLAPTDSSVRTALAIARMNSGDLDFALRELQLLAKSEDSTDADLKLISVRLARKEGDAALEAIDLLQKKQPDRPVPYELRGQALLIKNQPAQARAAFLEALQRDKLYAPALGQLAAMDLREGKPLDAIKLVTDASNASPNDGTLLSMRAEVLLKTGGAPQEIEAILERATKASPQNPTPWLMLMMKHFVAGDTRSALNVGQAAIAAIPGNVPILELQGRAQLKAGDSSQAIGTFANIVRISPRSPSGYMGQAASLLQAGNAAAAATVIDRLLEVDPKSIDGLRMASDIAIRRKQFPAAMKIARQLEKEYPAYAVGPAMAGDAELAQGHFGAAAAAYQRSLTLKNGQEVARRLHLALSRSDRQAEASKFAADWLKQNPKDTTFMLYLGDLALAANNMTDARERYAQVLALDDKSVPALNNLAWLLWKSKDPGALELAKRALAAKPDNPQVLDTLAQIYASQGKFPEAIQALKTALSRAAEPGPLRIALAKIYMQSDDRPSAAAELERLVDLGRGTPQYAEARKLLAEARKQ